MTTPVLETVTTAVFDDCHVAWLVTFCVVPFDSVAVAVYCVVAPAAGGVPEIAIDIGVGAVAAPGVVVVEDGLGLGAELGLEHAPAATSKNRKTRRIGRQYTREFSEPWL